MLEALEDRIVPAQTWTVNVTTDTGAGNLQNHTGDLRFCAANAQTGDTIDFSKTLKGQTILLNSQIKLSAGITVIGEDLTNPNNPVPVNVTISGQNKTRAFEISNEASVTLTDLIFTAGNGTDGNGNAGNGGAVLVDSGTTATLNSDTFNSNNTTGKGTNGGAVENDGTTNVFGCSFSGNNSVNNGGAIENTSQLNVLMNMSSVATTFTTNTAANGNGGAIDSSGNGNGKLSVEGGTKFDKNSAVKGGAISTSDPTTLSNDFFGTSTANVASQGGGAVYTTPGTQPNPSSDTVTSCTFANNQAPLGGAIYTSTTLDVEKSTFSSNKASTNGGGLDVNYQDQPNNPMGNNEQLTLNLDTFDSNTATFEGGGAFILANATTNGHYRTTVTNDTFSNNQAQANGMGGSGGGGLYLEEDTAGVTTNISATLTNLTFFNNTSNGHGGGLLLTLTDSTGSNMDCSATLTSLTVNLNTAAIDSGGIYVNSALKGVVTVDNSIFDGNTVTANGYNGAVDVTMTNNLTLTDEGHNLVGLTDTMFVAGFNGNIANNNPGLAAALAANGAPAGYPLTLALQKTSPGYETGDQNLTGFNDQGQDERGYLRQTSQGAGAPKVSIGAEDPDAKPPG